MPDIGVERRLEFRVWVEGQGTKKEIPDVGVERHAFGLALELQDGIRDRNLLASVGVPCYAENVLLQSVTEVSLYALATFLPPSGFHVMLRTQRAVNSQPNASVAKVVHAKRRSCRKTLVSEALVKTLLFST